MAASTAGFAAAFLCALVAFTFFMCLTSGLAAVLTLVVPATAVVAGVAAAAATGAAGMVVLVTAAGVAAKDAIATPETKAAAIRDLIFNMVKTHS